ncbi:MAG: hypothetical protein EAZ61_10165 [Oscillatoriales cyanobacterium]|nr:MAG: hypothetical protein EAZ61_10165 [Oscillatoriales cyanobacterium]
MPQHACIAIGIDRYRYMQPLRYALEDAREFHAAIAQLDARETDEAIDDSTLPATALSSLGAIQDWSQLELQNGYQAYDGEGNGSIVPPIATLEPLTIAPPDDTQPDQACHLLLTETSPQVNDRSTYPTREAILHALYRWTRNTVTPDQTLWCFFSGYGLEVDGIDYLLPIEGNPNRLDETAIPIETVFDALAAAPTDRVVLILDINRPTSADRDSDIGLQTYTLAKARNIPTILSCQPHQRSYETRDLRHGLFSAILLEALRHRKCPTLESLDRYLTDRVPELCDLHLQPIQTPLLALGAGVPSPWILWDTTPPAMTPKASEPPDTSHDPHNTVSVAPQPIPADDSTLAIEPDSAAGITTDITTDPINPAELTLPEPIDTDTMNPEMDASRDVDTQAVAARSWLGLGSSLVVWIGLFGSVLGLGVWLNGQVSDRAIESDPAEPAQSPVETPTVNSPPNTAPSSPNPPVNSTTSTASDPPPSSNASQTGSSDPSVTPPPSPQSQTTTSTQNQTPPKPPSSLTPALEPSTIAALHRLQASPLSAAIIQARRLTPKDTGYSNRQQNIERWGTTIFEIAQSRADQGQWMIAIAAARLVPPELKDLRERAGRSIQWWTQAQVNEQIIAAARKMPVPNQASSYWRAIARLGTIKQGQPFDDVALAQVESWATTIVTIARQRAAQGQLAAAIQAAQLVPPQTAAYAEARREIARWQSSTP